MSLISFRPYQRDAFLNRETGVEVWLWSRQIGKSFTLAAWAVDRLLTRPGRVVTVLSNSKFNGAELNLKCGDVCDKLGAAYEQEDLSPNSLYENMKMETRITVKRKTGRILVLAANPRTARGFSGDLILDEFAFHENSQAIWEAAEPILSSHPDYLCRVASTPNGKYNVFYTMATSGAFPVRLVRRSDAFRQGMKIYHPITRAAISPDEARAASLDKRAYDQNYECIFCDENMALLTLELISAAEVLAHGYQPLEVVTGDNQSVVCDQDWSPEALGLLRGVQGQIDLGVDVGRTRDLTVMTAGEKIGDMRFVRAILRCQGMRLPAQQMRLGEVCRMPKFHRAAIDMTGIGLGLCEYAQDEFGQSRIQGVNFGTSVPMPNSIRIEGRRGETVRVTEAMAMALLQCFEDRRIKIPCHPELRDDLRKPEKVVTPGGRVSIAASRTEAGHADHFWSMALMVEAGSNSGPFVFAVLNAQKIGQRSVWTGSLKGGRPGVLC